MKDRLLSCGLAMAVICCFPLLLPAVTMKSMDGSEAKSDTLVVVTREYTAEHPLVYEDAWDLWPYAYRDDTGNDVGFNVDLVRTMMERLGIPYVIELKDRSEVLQDMQAQKADLTLGMQAPYHNPYGFYGKSIIKLFTHSVVWPKGKPRKVFCEDDLRNQQVMVHTGSFSHYLMENNGWGANVIRTENTKNAILGMSQKQEGQMVWNTISLQWLLHTYHLDNLDIAPIAMEDGIYKFMSRDTLLLDRLDQEFKALQQDGTIEDLHHRWFYYDEQRYKYPLWLWNVLNAAVVAAIILFLYILFSLWREREDTRQGRLRARQLALVMHVSHLSIWLYDVTARAFIWLDKDGVARKRYSEDEFTKRIEGPDHGVIMETVRQLVEEEKSLVTIEVSTFAESNPTGGTRTYVITFSVLRYHEKKPSLIMAVCNDVTEAHRKQIETRTNLQHYQSVFNSNMIDMLYFDSQGYVADMNERAQRTLKMSLQEAKDRKVGLKNIIGPSDLDYANFDYYYGSRYQCAHTDEAALMGEKPLGPALYQFQLLPVRKPDGTLDSVYGSGRDITETVNTYRRIQQNIAKLKHTTDVMTRYAEDVNYVMDVGGVRTIEYSPDTHLLTIYKGYDLVQYSLTQSRFMSLIDESCLKKAMREVNGLDERSKNRVDVDLKTTLRHKGHPLYLNVSLIAVYDDNDGHLTNYFGMCRDISEIRLTEQLLERETARALEVENLKNSFLRNMIYEIRTPLNVVVGFAELFELPHSREDEEVFIREIKHNSAHLLQLINDILFLSRLDAQMIEINKQYTDFALLFDAFCAQGWADHQRPGVNYLVENNYEHLVVEIDELNVGRVIEQIVNNATQHTENGFVRARYDYMGGNLLIAIEDSGHGISAERLKRVYERFASSGSGTGLGLPICKELVEQMGGTIEIVSEVGEGTTVWISLPCAVSTNSRKTVK